MSGTPVICSNNGACPEIVTADVGFVCATDEDYRQALLRIDEIRPDVCREKAAPRLPLPPHGERLFDPEYQKEIAYTADPTDPAL